MDLHHLIRSRISKEIQDDDDEIVAMIHADSSDEDDTRKQQRGDSRKGKKPNIDRNRQLYATLLFQDYWGSNPVYPKKSFKTSFHMPRELFDEILEKVTQHSDYFQQKPDALGLPGLTSLQKVACSVRQLTSGVSYIKLDDKYRMAASTGLEALKLFCKAISDVYGEDALRPPTKTDINRLLDEGLAAGWPGCLGSLDCMHWQWKNCPSGWKGMFQGKEKTATVVLEAIAGHSCRFWHFFFGTPGALNDLNVLDRSPLHDNALKGIAPRVEYQVNGNTYRVPYWLVDGIYPEHHCFVKTIPLPNTPRTQYFAKRQEDKQKDIERAFGMLQARFHILTTPCRLWSKHAMKTVIKACVILHNLIIDFEKEHNLDSTYILDKAYKPEHQFVVLTSSEEEQANVSDSDRRIMLANLQSRRLHNTLKYDLIKHIWEEFSNKIT